MEAHGLEIHPNKTKLLTSQKANTLRKTEVDDMQVEILLLNLGQMIT